jgi:zinc transporter
MTMEDGLLSAYVLDGQGGGRSGGWELVHGWKPSDGLLWVHLDRTDMAAHEWAREVGLDAITRSALFAETSRPRSLVRGEGLLVDLRGVNLNPGAEPDDMISMRMFVEEHRIITLRRRRLKSIEDMRTAIDAGTGPRDAGEFMIELADMLDRRVAASLVDLDERIDSLDERIVEESGATLRTEISALRRDVIALRRYLAPQREAVSRLQSEKVPWLTSLHRERLRELADRTTRRVEDLDSARDRASVAHEELASRMAEQMNHTMYVLAIVAAIFLPLGLLTGLFGINVGGMPGVEEDAAFWIVCGFLVVVAAFQFWLFRRMKWL